MKNLFSNHLHDVGETYWEHLCFATKVSCKLILLSITALIHAIFPFILVKNTSDGIINLVKTLSQGERGKNFNKRIIDAIKE